MVKLSRSQRRKSIALWLCVFAIDFVAASLVSIAPVSTVWTRESRTAFPSNEFRVVVFPTDDDVWLSDSAGTQSLRLDRALALSLDEWNSDGPIGVFVGPTEIMFAERADLRLTAADADAEDRWVDLALEAQQQFFDPRLDAMRRFDYFSPEPSEHRVNAYMTNGDIYTSEYRTEGDSVVTPLKARLTSASAPQDVPPLRAAMSAAGFATVAIVVYWIGLALRPWWASQRHEAKT